jgi:hypothetical protein
LNAFKHEALGSHPSTAQYKTKQNKKVKNKTLEITQLINGKAEIQT